MAGRRICRDSSGAGRGWALRSDRLFGKSADARDWSAHGARSTAKLGVQAGDARGGVADSSGAGNRADLLDWSVDIDSQTTLRCAGVGRDHSDVRGRLAWVSFGGGKLSSRASRGFSESSGSFARRVGALVRSHREAKV